MNNFARTGYRPKNSNISPHKMLEYHIKQNGNQDFYSRYYKLQRLIDVNRAFTFPTLFRSKIYAWRP